MRRDHCLVLLLLVPVACEANSGIPVGFFSIQYSVLFLVPIVFAEAWVLHDDLKIPYVRAAGTTAISNILSTLAGVVVAIFLAPIIVNGGLTAELLVLVLFMPMYFLSCYIELMYSEWSLQDIDRKALKRSIYRANLVSYMMLTVCVVTRLIKNWLMGTLPH